MASISGSIGATEVLNLVPYFCQARDGGYECGSYSQFRAHLAIFQPIWRKGLHRPKFGIISYVTSAFSAVNMPKSGSNRPIGKNQSYLLLQEGFSDTSTTKMIKCSLLI